MTEFFGPNFLVLKLKKKILSPLHTAYYILLPAYFVSVVQFEGIFEDEVCLKLNENSSSEVKQARLLNLLH
jgi:hypothetical protein